MVVNLENGIAKIDPKIYKGLLAKLIASYRYFNNNQQPEKVIIPFVEEIDGVPIEFEYPKEEANATVSRKSRTG